MRTAALQTDTGFFAVRRLRNHNARASFPRPGRLWRTSPSPLLQAWRKACTPWSRAFGPRWTRSLGVGLGPVFVTLW